MPPTTVVPTELRAADPAPVAIASGITPRMNVIDVIRIDGTKLVLADGSWLLFRKSGTEPVVRLYGESSSAARLQEVMRAGKEFILSGS